MHVVKQFFFRGNELYLKDQAKNKIKSTLIDDY